MLVNIVIIEQDRPQQSLLAYLLTFYLIFISIIQHLISMLVDVRHTGYIICLNYRPNLWGVLLHLGHLHLTWLYLRLWVECFHHLHMIIVIFGDNFALISIFILLARILIVLLEFNTAYGLVNSFYIEFYRIYISILVYISIL